MQGTKLECKYHIVTGRVSAAKTIVKCVENAGLIASDVIVEPIASAHAVLSEEEIKYITQSAMNYAAHAAEYIIK